MLYNNRKKKLIDDVRSYFVNGYNEWITIDIVNLNRVDIIGVTERANDILLAKKYIHKKIEEINLLGVEKEWEVFTPGIIELYTEMEAKFLQLDRTVKVSGAASFSEFIDKNDLEERYEEKKIIAFYSYKGGVGRTSALIQTAYSLAERGKNVALIDLDLESPSFNYVFSNDIQSDTGLIDYLHENIYDTNIERNNSGLEIDSFITKLNKGFLGDIYIIPAGEVNYNYIKKLERIKQNSVYKNSYIEYLIEKIKQMYDIDYILIDSVNGINKWAALALTDLASDIFIFGGPNKEDISGIKLILDIIGSKRKSTIVMSKIKGHGEKVAKSLLNDLGIYEDFISIKYDPDIEGASNYITENRLEDFDEISNFILGNDNTIQNKRWIYENKEKVRRILDKISAKKLFSNVVINNEINILDKSKFIIVKNNNVNLENLFQVNNKKINKIDMFKLDVNLINATNSPVDSLSVILAYLFSSFEELFSIEVKAGLEGFEDRVIAYSEEFINVKRNKNVAKIYEDKCNEISERLSQMGRNDNIYMYWSLNDLGLLLRDVEQEWIANEKSLLDIIFLATDIINSIKNINLKIIMDEDVYENINNYDMSILAGINSNILNLSLKSENKDALRDIITEILDKSIMYLNNSVMRSETILRDLNLSKEDDINLNLVYCERIVENSYSKTLAAWLAERLIYVEDLSKEVILDVIAKAAEIEKSNENYKRNSIITFESFKKALEDEE
ncbi:tyrosine-protein kinase family protein [Clostridium septicum]|uniref:tyrosine-protein kinase family protein n=1 Tax=Clostridium septicum TaxID=1504 RepID=UPI0008335E98|nr:AAA family ATPase [Clostridium septicum]